MDWSIILVDIVVSVMLFISMWYLMIQLFFTEGGFPVLLGCGIPFVTVALLLTVLRPIRYPLAGVLIVVMSSQFFYRYLRYYRPRQQYLQRVYRYYGEALQSHIGNSPIVNLTAYGHRYADFDHDQGSIYLFTTPDDYARYFSEYKQLSGEWHFVEIPAMPHDPILNRPGRWGITLDMSYHVPHLFIVLTLQRKGQSPLIMPIFAGAKHKDGSSVRYHPSYLGTLALQHLDNDLVQLQVYPLEKSHHKEIIRQLDVTDYFNRHLADQPSTVLDVPYFDAEQIEKIWSGRQPKKSGKRINSNFRIFPHRQMHEAIYVARELQHTKN